MSVSKPPPESEQLIATGDNTQMDQPTGQDSSKQQTVTLKLTLDDILEGGNLLNGREFPVSGRMKFIFENCKNAVDQTTPTDQLTSGDNNLTSQPLPSAQQEYDSDSQKLVYSIDNSKSTLNEASGLLQKCAENLEEMKALLRSLSESSKKIEDIEQEVEREIKSTTEAVMGMLKGLAGDTATVPTNDDDDDHSPDDDKDSDGSDRSNEDPKRGDTSGEPTDPSADPSEKNEDSKESHPTDLTKEQSKHGSTESAAETDDAEDSSQVLPHSTTTQTPNEPTDSISEGLLPTETSSTLPLGSEGENLSASKLDDKEIVEDKLSEGDESKKQVLETELGGRSEEAPVKGASPQQEAELPQEPSALIDLPLSAVTEKPGEQGEMKKPPAPGVDKKEGNFDETPDAGIASQQTTEPSQEPSSPTESAIEKTPIEGKADNSGDAKVPELEEVQEHDSDTAEPTLSKSQKKKLKKKENEKNQADNSGSHGNVVAQPDVRLQEVKNVREKDTIGVESQIPMDVLLFLFLAEMNTIREKQTNPNEVQLPKMLKGISLFYNRDNCKKMIINPENDFEELLGETWKDDSENEICEHLVHLFAHETYKSSARSIIAYLYNEHEKAKNPKEKRACIRQILAVLQEELISWNKTTWLKNAKDYFHYRMQEAEESDKFAWKKNPPKYNDNQVVLERIEHYKTNQDTFENRLIFECYTYLTTREKRFYKSHRILDSDLDYICTRRSTAHLERVQGKFFSAVFGFEAQVLETLPEESTTSGLELQDPKPENTNQTQSIPKEGIPSEKSMEHTLTLLFSTLTCFKKAGMPLEQTTLPNIFKEISNFRKSEDWAKYDYMEFDDAKSKVLEGQGKSDKDKEFERRFCEALGTMSKTVDYEMYVEEMIKFWCHIQTNDGIFNGYYGRVSFAKDVDTNVRCYIHKDRKQHFEKYVHYCENRLTNQREQEKYNWKQPLHYKESPHFQERCAYYSSNEETCNNYIFAGCYKVLKEFAGRNKILDDNFDYIFTGPKELFEETENKFILAAFNLTLKTFK